MKSSEMIEVLKKYLTFILIDSSKASKCIQLKKKKKATHIKKLDTTNTTNQENLEQQWRDEQ